MEQKSYKVGDMRYGHKVLPKSERKKILLLSDDLRQLSGIASMSREIVLGTCHQISVLQLGSAIKHPEQGQIFDLSQSVSDETGVEDPEVKVIPFDGYGNPEILRELLIREQPDAILHFTDPRFWGWLYNMEAEVRQICPIIYYNIWDNAGKINDKHLDPEWNTAAYKSSDMLLAISKQTYGINKRLLPEYEDWQIKYVPHGINTKHFYPIREGHDEWNALQDFRAKLLGDLNDTTDFIIVENNRNIRRKNYSDTILAYKDFCDTLPKEKSEKCLLILHTQPIDQNGTDLLAVVKAVCPEYNVMFSTNPGTTKDLCYFYNIADVAMNLASNEGFGLTTAEALMCGTPILVNVTGGLQDQCGFNVNGKLLTADDYIELNTLHDAEDCFNKFENLNNGVWAFPVWPTSRSLKGSVPTPYIYDDTVDYREARMQLEQVYQLSKKERDLIGMEGYDYMCNKSSSLNHKDMCTLFMDSFTDLFANWKPKKKWKLVPAKTTRSTRLTKIKFGNIAINKTLQPQQQELKLPKLKKIDGGV